MSRLQQVKIRTFFETQCTFAKITRESAIAEGPRDAVSVEILSTAAQL